MPGARRPLPRPAAAPTAAAPASSASPSWRSSCSSSCSASPGGRAAASTTARSTAYRTYFDGVGAAINDSEALGKQVSAIMEDPTSLSRKELIDKLEQLTAQQEEIAVRAGRLEPPGTLDDEQTVFSTGMKVRAERLPPAAHGHARRPRQQEGRRQGDHRPRRLLQRPGRVLPGARLPAGAGDHGGRGRERRRRAHLHLLPHVEGPRPGHRHPGARERGQVVQALRHPRRRAHRRHRPGQLGRPQARPRRAPTTSRPRPTSPSSSRSRTRAASPRRTCRSRPRSPCPAAPPTPSSRQASIASIESGKTQDVTITGFAIPTEALSKEVTLRVIAGPVKGERVETNNRATYKLLLQLK